MVLEIDRRHDAGFTKPKGSREITVLEAGAATDDGTATYLSVPDSRQSLFAAEPTLAQARNNEYQSLVQLYKALGGDWK